VAHSEESEIYRCNDPRQGGGEVFSQPEENLRLSEIEKEKYVEKKGARIEMENEIAPGRPAGGIRSVEG